MYDKDAPEIGPAQHPGFDHFPPGSSQFIDHPSHAKPGIHVFPDKLHVVTVIENPLRWRSRYWNYNLFEAMVERAGAILYTVEIAFGDRAFEVTRPGHPRQLQLRTTDELLHKENALNLGVAGLLPRDWKKVAWLDADVQFQRPDWAQETLHLLEHYKVLQMFSHALDLGPQSEPLDMNESFISHELSIDPPHLPQTPAARTERRRKKCCKCPDCPCCPCHDPYGPSGGGKLHHPGLAWAMRREAWDAVGGLMDQIMGGSADHYMALALFNLIAEKKNETKGYRYLNIHDFPEGYKRPVLEWQHRAERFIRRNVGVMPGLITHYWHGPKQKRQYLVRAKFLAQMGFNPIHDLKRDWQGLWQLHDDGSPRSIKLRDGLRVYSRLRDEDSNEAQKWNV
jgi:hypothetical protein